jgi:hypothetical protein
MPTFILGVNLMFVTAPSGSGTGASRVRVAAAQVFIFTFYQCLDAMIDYLSDFDECTECSLNAQTVQNSLVGVGHALGAFEMMSQANARTLQAPTVVVDGQSCETQAFSKSTPLSQRIHAYSLSQATSPLLIVGFVHTRTIISPS